ncbi:SH3 domain-containing protein [uncultured Roseovarius sp.]|uniref:SH3 domain-containing protein n=1 Tax=uncultured Roseovarius sp. TaxID=293344 RepID=UPI00260F287D|nr:SH3 domain-containing protein [uncultured Roseovarius sp.]
MKFCAMKRLVVLMMSSAFIAFNASCSLANDVENTVPVLIDPQSGCEAAIEVVGLQNVAGNFLAVRNGPGTDFSNVGKLQNGDFLWYCSDNGDWLGVVVENESGTCEIPSEGEYDGTCLSGWVSRNYTKLIAG